MDIKYVCHFCRLQCQGGMAHRHHSWVGLLVALEACTTSGAMKASHGADVAFRSVPAQGSLGLGSEMHGIFSNRHSSGQPKATVITPVFWESLGQL